MSHGSLQCCAPRSLFLGGGLYGFFFSCNGFFFSRSVLGWGFGFNRCCFNLSFCCLNLSLSILGCGANAKLCRQVAQHIAQACARALGLPSDEVAGCIGVVAVHVAC